MSTSETVFAALQQMMSGGACPVAGSLGECAAMDFICIAGDGSELWTACVYVWRDDVQDAGAIAAVALAAGALDVVVSHVLHDTLNGDADGRTIDGARAWRVDVYLPAEGRKPDRASDDVVRPAGAPASLPADKAGASGAAREANP